MYRPKDSARWQSTPNSPIRLDDQCLNVVYKMFTKASEKLASVRNVREKKAVREFITMNLPISLQSRIMQKALNKLMGVQVTLKLLDIFEPGQMAKDSIDLLGPFRLGFGCYVKDGRLTWSQGSAKKFNLTVPQLDQLYNIMLWAKPSQIKEFNISIARDSIKLSKVPNILAQARSLTRVTILSGADNHILRILGINCSCLLTLDVSHSIKVTDQGLRSLLLKRRSQNRSRARPKNRELENCSNDEKDGYSEETNPCATTITSIILVGTAVTWKGCDLACKLMNFGYFTAALPFVKIVRVRNEGLCFKGLPFDRQILSIVSNSSLSDDSKNTILSSVNHTLLPENLKNVVLDFYTMECPKRSQCTINHSFMFLRDNAESFKMHLYLKMESANVTSLVLPWYTFTWKVDSLVDLDTLGTYFPSLRFLKGRIKGQWNRGDEPLLSNLQAAYVWSLNGSTAVSMLQSIPCLKFLEFNNTKTVMIHNGSNELSDATLETALNDNKSLARSLESFTVRPADLTSAALKTLTTKCPNLKRIGDLESWDITSSQIAEFNAYLDSARSQVILTVMNFPPLKEEKYQWDF